MENNVRELRGLPYFGGKSYGGNNKLNQWINGLLPVDTDVVYVEPFAGMLGVFLSRPRHKLEIVNDLSSNIVNWWYWVRNKPKKMVWHIRSIPHSRQVYDEALKRLNSKEKASTFQDAIDYTVVILQSVRRRIRDSFSVKIDPMQPARWWRSGIDNRIMFLAERMKNVTLENADATYVLNKVAHIGDAVIYVDPPYYSITSKRYYEHNDVDVEKLTQALLLQRGWVAISGYDDEWDHLNWEKHTKDAKLHLVTGERIPKQEVLWTNYIAEEKP